MEDYQANANDNDDDIIGEEVRPLPIDISMDGRSRALQAILLDHTYVQNTVSLEHTKIFEQPVRIAQALTHWSFLSTAASCTEHIFREHDILVHQHPYTGSLCIGISRR